MQKQITYPKFTPRLLSTMIDLILATLISEPILWFVKNILFKIALSAHSDITIENAQFMLTQQRIETDDKLKYDLIAYLIELCIAQFILLGAYYVVFWHYFGYTPGKYFFRMRIVNSETGQHPTLWMFIKRFIGYSLAPFSLITMLVDKSRHRGIHDRIAHTVVVLD